MSRWISKGNRTRLWRFCKPPHLHQLRRKCMVMDDGINNLSRLQNLFSPTLLAGYLVSDRECVGTFDTRRIQDLTWTWLRSQRKG